MHTFVRLSSIRATAVFGCVLACFLLQEIAVSQAGQSIVPYLQERLRINEAQAKGGLGALLVFARDRLAKPEFDQLAKRMPNADNIVQQTHARGVVTHPLDDVDDYEAVLANLGISRESSRNFAPAVLDYLESNGYSEERDILSKVLD